MTIEGCFDFSRKGQGGVDRLHGVHHVDDAGSLVPRFLVVLNGKRRDIGDENVDPAERGGAVRDEALERRLVRHVDSGAEGVSTL